MRLGLALMLLGALGACAERPQQQRIAVAYPGQPVQSMVGTGYAATPGLPLPPRNEEGVIPAPPPRYMGDRSTASSANVAAVRRDDPAFEGQPTGTGRTR